ncbi:hypothetical protein Zm00014a_029564 [Zea mays]|uniref:Uncharacterized protein n=1 Tax=Zea mays TaxID=4577 RepID=A0A317Y038_MAIZE|nr:hypothetical protein Zm00014a_029564 [Zea mays]
MAHRRFPIGRWRPASWSSTLLHLLSGITELDDRKQRKLCLKKFRSRDEHLSEVDTKRELECGLCMRCFEYWHTIMNLYRLFVVIMLFLNHLMVVNLYSTPLNMSNL